MSRSDSSAPTTGAIDRFSRSSDLYIFHRCPSTSSPSRGDAVDGLAVFLARGLDLQAAWHVPLGVAALGVECPPRWHVRGSRASVARGRVWGACLLRQALGGAVSLGTTWFFERRANGETTPTKPQRSKRPRGSPTPTWASSAANCTRRLRTSAGSPGVEMPVSGWRCVGLAPARTSARGGGRALAAHACPGAKTIIAEARMTADQAVCFDWPRARARDAR